MTSGAATDVETRVLVLTPKPRFRGWLHHWSFVGSMAAGATLVTASATLVGSATAVVSCAIYVTSVLGLFGISALYHRHRWRTEAARTRMRRLDHSMIFIFIAGTYTPVSAMALESTTRVLVLSIVWAGALAGVALQLIWPTAPRWVGVPIYLALGWVAVFVIPDLLHQAGVTALVLILVGGAMYTAGALCYTLKRPDPWPTTFGYHEIFHAATVLAATCHYVAIWFVLMA